MLCVVVFDVATVVVDVLVVFVFVLIVILTSFISFVIVDVVIADDVEKIDGFVVAMVFGVAVFGVIVVFDIFV